MNAFVILFHFSIRSPQHSIARQPQRARLRVFIGSNTSFGFRVSNFFFLIAYIYLIVCARQAHHMENYIFVFVEQL